MSYFSFFMQAWLPTVQDVLQADWQEVWHSPHPPPLTVLEREGRLMVIICLPMGKYPPPFESLIKSY
jgi:hypothetical protein